MFASSLRAGDHGKRENAVASPVLPSHGADGTPVLELHAVDDPRDRGLEADVVAAADGVARGAAEDDEDALADAGAERVDGDHGLGGRLAREREGLHDEEAQALERRVLDRG